MCDDHPGPNTTHRSRRDVLALGAAAVIGAGAAATFAVRSTRGAAAATEPVDVGGGLLILPRDAWGADLPPRGPITGEDPLFLLVHHTASSNSYPSGGARSVIRATYSFQTGPAKGWPDVCYQFFVDRDGFVWEGRAGALGGPVRADATGGSQGWAQLVCLIGDFTSVQPTAAAQESLVRVLAWLADRYMIDTSPGATASFVSRGSQRWPAGAPVTAPTISGHREMSYTACPGNAFYPVVRDELQARVHAARRPIVVPPGPDGLRQAERGRRRTVTPG